jgi:hypothetical protein
MERTRFLSLKRGRLRRRNARAAVRSRWKKVKGKLEVKN